MRRRPTATVADTAAVPAPATSSSATTATAPNSSSAAVDRLLAGVHVSAGAMAFTADDVARHCVVSAAPGALPIGANAVFVPEEDLERVQSAVADLLDPRREGGSTG